MTAHAVAHHAGKVAVQSSIQRLELDADSSLRRHVMRRAGRDTSLKLKGYQITNSPLFKVGSRIICPAEKTAAVGS